MTYPANQPLQPPGAPSPSDYSQQAYAGPPAYPAQQWQGAPGYGPRAYAQPPAITTTVVITLFFGLFGLIPASMHSSRAREMGQPTGKYWKAFWITFGVEIAIIVLFYVIVFAAIANSVGYSY
jgi:hypothetical protein